MQRVSCGKRGEFDISVGPIDGDGDDDGTTTAFVIVAVFSSDQKRFLQVAQAVLPNLMGQRLSASQQRRQLPDSPDQPESHASARITIPPTRMELRSQNE